MRPRNGGRSAKAAAAEKAGANDPASSARTAKVDAKAHSQDGWRPRFNPWLIAVVVTLAAFMEILDTTIVNVALPYIAGSLSVSSDQATYALTAYLVANGIVLTVSGWLSDTIGRKRYFMIFASRCSPSARSCAESRTRSRSW